MKTYQKIAALVVVAAFGLVVFWWVSNKPAVKTTSKSDAAANSVSNANTEIPPDRLIEVEPSYAQTPTDAFKGLFEAVKAKDTEKIKSFMTQQTLAFAQAQAAMKKEPVENMYKNGFLATTMVDKLPEIRDQRIKGEMGAIEIYNEKEKKWEDSPFIFENGGWKLAIGEVFSGKYQPPGKGQYQKELDASNKTLGAGTTPSAPDSAPQMPPATK